MNVKPTLILTSGLLFLSVPAWGDSMKSRQTPDSDTSTIVNTSNDWSRVGQNEGGADVRDRGGFDTEGSKHRGHRHSDEDRDRHRHRDRDRDRDHFDSDDFPPTFKGPTPSGPTSGGPSNPVGTPEPGSLALLVSGLICLGSSFYKRFYRRNQSLLSSNHPAS